jgi:lytic cellulose monooxygenase (C4-dehydrogenating)
MSSVRFRLLISSLIAALVAAIAITALPPTSPASAHGSVVSPASRNYSCWQRWGSDFQNPRMATEDPMCWQAWQADPNAMWNWNGLFREGVAGNHQGAVPDGQLCSGGRTASGRYNALDAVGNWTATSLGNSFNLRFFDQASHGADYIRVYVTRPGYNPLTQPLRWSDLELAAQIGNTPASQWTPATGGVQIEIPVRLSGRSGRAIVYTVWQASHLDQSYYLCSDVNFGGTSTPPPTTPPPTTPPPTTPPPTTPPPTTPPPAGSDCTAAYRVDGSWQNGYQATVTVRAGSAAIRGWNVRLTYPAAATVTQSWNATMTGSGSTLTATNVGHNGTLAAGASTSFGFLGSGTSQTPTLSCTGTA